MNKLLAGMIAGAVFLAAGQSGMAQEKITIAGIDATRVIIAPPQDAISTTIKAGLAEAYYTAREGSSAYNDAQKLYFFYGARHFEPLWLTEAANGQVIFSENAQKIIAVFEQANLTGLNPADYLTDAINLEGADTDPQTLAALETAFSAAAIRYAEDTHSGRIDPRRVSSDISIKPDHLDEADVLMQLATSADPAALLLSFEPKHREFRALKQALAGFYDGTAEEPVVIPNGKTLKRGMQDERVPLMRTRLGLPTPADPTDIAYDDQLVAAIETFQDDLGLQVDGVAGPATIAALNGGSATSKGDIIANMERWRWMPQDLGDFRVMVNIPEFRLSVMQGETAIHSTRVVVGTSRHKTPIFSDQIRHIVVNPYWNVPASIASNEIAPKLVSNPGYIAGNNMELLFGGKVVDAAAFDWSATNVNNFRIRQRPGSSNALGSVKFLFPNSHNVYLHDTPSKSLFSRSFRAFSHGCVRVQDPWEFAQALLQNDTKLSRASLEAQRGPSERWNNLEHLIPVHLTYFTLRVDMDGSIRSYGDVYGHNQKLKDLMGV